MSENLKIHTKQTNLAGVFHLLRLTQESDIGHVLIIAPQLSENNAK